MNTQMHIIPVSIINNCDDAIDNKIMYFLRTMYSPRRRIRARRLLGRRRTRLDGTWTGTARSRTRRFGRRGRRDRNHGRRRPTIAPQNRQLGPARISRHRNRLRSGFRNAYLVCNHRRRQRCDHGCSGPPFLHRRLVCGMATGVCRWPWEFRESHFPFWNLDCGEWRANYVVDGISTINFSWYEWPQ